MAHSYVIFTFSFSPYSTVAAPMANATCTNGLEGIESEGVCCDARCGVCGGPTCGNVAGLEGTECCINQIQTAGQLCSVTNAAPCVVDVGEFNQTLFPSRMLFNMVKFQV